MRLSGPHLGTTMASLHPGQARQTFLARKLLELDARVYL
jgi:hypothetical protein